jgi:lysophospholipase L1-like esterase
MSSPFTAPLTAKCVDYWSVSDWAGGAATWAGRINSTVLTPAGTVGPAKLANAFGTNPGVHAVTAVYSNTPSSFSLPAERTDVTGVFGVVKSNDVTSPTPATSGSQSIGSSFLAGDAFLNNESFFGGQDCLAWLNFTDGGMQGTTVSGGNKPFYATAYVNGAKVGAVANRRTGTQVLGVVVTAGSNPAAKIANLYATNGYGCTEDTWGDVAIFNQALTAGDIAEIQTVMQAAGQFTPAALQRQIIFIGDSLTECITGCVETDSNHSWPGILVRAIGATSVDWANLGGFGAITTQANQTVQGIGADCLAATRPAKVAVVWIGTNDVNAGTSAATITTNWQSICTNLRSEGATRIIGLTMIPRNFSGNQAAYDAVKLTANANMIGLVGSSFDKVIDLTTIPQFGTPSTSWQDGTIYTPDGVHLQQAGLNLVAGAFSPSDVFPTPPHSFTLRGRRLPIPPGYPGSGRLRGRGL